MTRALLDYYRCPQDYVRLVIEPRQSEKPGFFRFGSDVTCFGSLSNAKARAKVTDKLNDVWSKARACREGLSLPFDPAEVVDNLRLEHYVEDANKWGILARKALKHIYYFLRPVAPSFLRTSVQRMYYSRWHEIPFPKWPMDFSVDRIHQGVMALLLQHGHTDKIPFIWFWPDGAPACAMMTHDVEAIDGRDFCKYLMDMDDDAGIKAAFQIVPEHRYPVPDAFLDSIRNRGFEINVHDLNHDGFLFHDRKTFLTRAAKINQYVHRFSAFGFRAGAMYRNAAWYGDLDISYDMSIPNAAHMEPQRGGCCTVMPYFIGNVLELPLTTTQDFALINVIRQQTCELWRQEIDMISAEHGLISFIVHPDYLISSKAQQMYKELLSHLADLRSAGKLWIALPKEVNDWWRQRAQMRLRPCGDGWTIEGPGHEHARVAFAQLVDGRLTYTVEPACASKPAPANRL